ncbi:MAG TPA: PQQ-binding-like beta-propeller repeat protein [Ktedonobacteraceae bacterium]|nr:PQQ-binding-like beta-propeller repeat protein [Ktedonobacteraceae bacterium]
MSNDGTEFTPDQVERQIEMLAQARQAWPGASGDARLISELSRVSTEDEAIVQRSWQRLAECMKSTSQQQAIGNDSVQYRSPLFLFSEEQRELLAEQKGLSSREIRSREKRPRNKLMRLLEICAAILVVAALVISTTIVIGNIRQKQTLPTAATPGTTSGASALYVSSPAGVYRVDPASGKVLWHYADKSSIYSRPYVVDNVVIVADDSAGPNSDSKATVVGLDAFTGKPLWQKMIQETMMLTTGDGMFLFLDEYIPPSAPLPPLITAYQATTGQQLWSYQPPTRPKKFEPFHQGIIADGKLYVVFNGQVLLFQASSGMLLWQKSFPNVSVFSPPVVSGNMLYFVGSRSNEPNSLLFGINAVNGEDFQSQVPVSEPQDVRALNYNLTVVNGVVYVNVSLPPSIDSTPTVMRKGTAYLYTYNGSNGAFLARYQQTPGTSFIYSRYPLHLIGPLVVFGMVNAGDIATYDLVAFNTTTKTRAWSVPIQYPDYAADFLQVANGVIYLNVGAHLYAYSLTGKLLRDYVIPVSHIDYGPAYGPFISVMA